VPSAIASVEDANQLLFNLVRFEQQSPRFIEDAVMRLADEVILQPIITKMKQAKYSQKIIEGTKIDNIQVGPEGFVTFDIISEYDAENGFDVATAREKGTRDHTIRPKRENGVLRWFTQAGQPIFAKFARVAGIKASNIIRDTVDLQFPIFQQRLTEEIVVFYNETVGQ
jgi:hypothetical protein